MSRFRLAHYSDIHLTLPPLRFERGLASKRMASALSYYSSRGRRFADVEARIKILLEDIDAAGVDHALCTGDLTQASWPEEFERLARIYGDRRQRPNEYTVIPGNHDRYTSDAVDRDYFGQSFGTVASPSGRYPYRKLLAEGQIALILVDVARPTAIDSSGLCGEDQRARLLEMLSDSDLAGRYVIVALHYGLLTWKGRRDHRRHGLVDDLAFIELIDRSDVNVDLVLHGHMHRPYAIRTARRTVLCAGSATDLSHGCGWTLLELDPQDPASLSLSRRVWSEERGAYAASSAPIRGWDKSGPHAVRGAL